MRWFPNAPPVAVSVARRGEFDPAIPMQGEQRYTAAHLFEPPQLIHPPEPFADAARYLGTAAAARR
jgi:hypothetical protein